MWRYGGASWRLMPPTRRRDRGAGPCQGLELTTKVMVSCPYKDAFSYVYDKKWTFWSSSSAVSTIEGLLCIYTFHRACKCMLRSKKWWGGERYSMLMSNRIYHTLRRSCCISRYESSRLDKAVTFWGHETLTSISSGQQCCILDDLWSCFHVFK